MRLRALVLALTFATPAWAADSVEIRYEMFWGGFRAAEARLVRTGAEAELAVRATGMADSLAAFALEAASQHDQFRSHSRSKSMESTLAVDFHGTPRTVIDEIRRSEPDDEQAPRPPRTGCHENRNLGPADRHGHRITSDPDQPCGRTFHRAGL